jgi:hypothetical protein
VREENKEAPNVRPQRILISVLVLATVAAPSWATSTTVYTDQTSFNTATSGVFFQSITFTSANLAASSTYSDPSGVVITDYIGNNTLSITGGNLVDTNSWGFAAALPNVVYDFWFTITGPAFSGLSVSFTAPDGTYNNSSFTVGGSGTFFFGVTSSAPITNLVFHNSSPHTDTLTAFDFAGGGGGPSDAPEGATLLLIGSGLIAMRFLKKRDKARGKQPQAPKSSTGVRYVTPQVAAG